MARSATRTQREYSAPGRLKRRLYTVGSKKLASGDTLWRLLCIHYYEAGVQRQTTKSFGCGPENEQKARETAVHLQTDEDARGADGNGFVGWHTCGQPLPIDRLIRKFAAIKCVFRSIVIT